VGGNRITTVNSFFLVFSYSISEMTST